MKAQKSYAKIIAKAWSNPKFKAKLLEHPEATLKELGIEIPKGKKVLMHENTKDTVHFVLPEKPTGELSITDLESLAAAAQCGGSGTQTGAPLQPAVICARVFMKLQLISDTVLAKTRSLALDSALQALKEGCSEEALGTCLDPDEQVLFFYHLEELKKQGLLKYVTPFLEIPLWEKDLVLKSLQDVSYSLCRFTLCRQDAGKFIIENPLTHVKGHLTEIGLSLIYALKKPISLHELTALFPSQDVENTLRLLSAAEMITHSGKESPTLAQWEVHDLYFHTRTRRGRIDVPYGATYRFKGTLPTQPPVKNCPHVPLIPLQRPKSELKISLEQAIAKRKSIREHGKEPMTIQQLGEFLFRCARIKDSYSQNEEEFTTRPYPGGGARYELEIYLVLYKCKGQEPGVYHYHPLEHALCKVSDLTQDAEQLLKDACRSSGKKHYPQVLLLFSSRFQRVSWKYQSIAYAVTLKNLGVLIQTMYLVATASNLAPCALGGGNSDLFCEVAKTNYLEETTVGEFMLGSNDYSTDYSPM